MGVDGIEAPDPLFLLGESSCVRKAAVDSLEREVRYRARTAEVGGERRCLDVVGDGAEMLTDAQSQRLRGLSDIGDVTAGTRDHVDTAGGGAGEAVRDGSLEATRRPENSSLLGVLAGSAPRSVALEEAWPPVGDQARESEDAGDGVADGGAVTPWECA